MKKIIGIFLISGLMLSSATINAQIGGLKKGINKVKSTTQTKDASTDNFSDLEKEKMEWTSTFERLQKKWEQLSHEEYQAKKGEYNTFYTKFSSAYTVNNKKKHSDEYTQKLITEIDGFYSDEVPAEKMEAIKKTASKSFDKESWSVYPSDRINDIENAEKQVNNARAYLKKPDPKLEAYEKTLKEQKETIIKYVNEGGLEKRDAEIEKRMVEKRMLHEAGMTDESITSVVNSKIDKNKYGNPIKVVITSKNWEYERNQFGHAKLKFVKVDIATKKSDGKCYYVKGSVAQQHEGGGVYGDKYLNIYYTEGEMNCNNVK